MLWLLPSPPHMPPPAPLPLPGATGPPGHPRAHLCLRRAPRPCLWPHPSYQALERACQRQQGDGLHQMHKMHQHQGSRLPLQSPQGHRGSGDALPVWDGDEEKVILNANANPDGRRQDRPLEGAERDSSQKKRPLALPCPRARGWGCSRWSTHRPEHPPRKGRPGGRPRCWGREGSAGAPCRSCRLRLLGPQHSCP